MILLKSEQYRIEEILKPTKAQWFSNLGVGTIVEFSLPLKRPGRSSRGLYATYVTLKNVTTGELSRCSLNESKILDNFRLQPITQGTPNET